MHYWVAISKNQQAIPFASHKSWSVNDLNKINPDWNVVSIYPICEPQLEIEQLVVDLAMEYIG